MNRIIVAGGRDYADAAAVAVELDTLNRAGPHTLVHGACKVYRVASDGRRVPYQLRPGETPGADRLAHRYALGLRWDVDPHPADWGRYGRAAGPIRNQEMADLGAVLLLVFPGGAGTADMVRRAAAAGIPVRRVGDGQ